MTVDSGRISQVPLGAHASVSGPPILVADDALFLDHVAPPDHPERGERLLAVRAGIDRAAAAVGTDYTRLQVQDASDEQLARGPAPRYVESLGHLAGRSGYLDADTYLSAGSVAAARRGAGAAVSLVGALHQGSAR